MSRERGGNEGYLKRLSPFCSNGSRHFVFSAPHRRPYSSAGMSKPGSPSSGPSSPPSTPPEKHPKPVEPKVSHPKGFANAIWDFMHAPWVITNIRKRRSQQLLFRSCLASWAALLLLLPTKSLQTYGNLYVHANSLITCALLCANRNDTSLVLISRCSCLCSSPQDIRYKYT
jgi:hypothetical protein